MDNKERKVKCPTSNAVGEKSEPGLGCLGGRNKVLFGPCGTFVRDLLFDAVGFVVKLMVPTLEHKVKSLRRKT